MANLWRETDQATPINNVLYSTKVSVNNNHVIVYIVYSNITIKTFSSLDHVSLVWSIGVSYHNFLFFFFFFFSDPTCP